MNKAGKSKIKIFTSIISVLVVVVLAVGLVWLASFFGARYATTAIEAGEIVLNSPEDVDKYFVFLERDEAMSLLKSEKESGKNTFLFPRVDLVFGGGPITIKQEAAFIEGSDVNFITFSGLAVGAKVYPGGENAAIGGISPSFVWFTERDKEDPVFAGTTYVAAAPDLGGLVVELDDIYRFIDQNQPLATLNVGIKMSVPVEAQVAVSIGDGSRNDYAVLANMLRKGGKFVLVK